MNEDIVIVLSVDQAAAVRLWKKIKQAGGIEAYQKQKTAQGSFASQGR